MSRPCKLGGETFDLLGFDELTMNEEIEIAQLVGLRGLALDEARLNQDREVTRAVVFLSIRRARPDVTLEEVGDHKITEFEVLDDADPPVVTPAADGTGGGGTSSRSDLETLAS